MAGDKDQVPAAGDGPTQEDNNAKQEAAAEDASEPTEQEKPKIINDPKFGKHIEEYSDGLLTKEEKEQKALEKRCCKGCCFPRSSEPRSPGYGGRLDAIEKALKDNQAATSASEQKASVTQPREEVAAPSAAAPAPAPTGAPPAADDLV